MRPITDRERRTLRLGGVGLGIYLVVFFGFQGWKYGEGRRVEYRRLQQEAAALNTRLMVYDDKVEATRHLMEQFRMDPARLSRTSVVARASAAIQQAAMQGGLQLGPIRESQSRGEGRELGTMQVEGMGPAPGVLRFLETVKTLGFPLVLESIQLGPAPMGPAMVKVNLNLVILDFEKWSVGERKPDA